MRSLTILFLFLAVAPRLPGATPDLDARFAEANRLYEAEEFEKSRDAYLALLDEGLSRQVFFNLGNANFRLGKLGEACLAYRRATLLDPGMVEATQNLRLLQRKLGFFQFEESGIGKTVARLTPAQWTGLAWTGGWIAVLGALGLALHRPRPPWNGTVLAAAICGGILTLLAVTGGALHHRSLDPANLFIVTAPDAVARTGPYPGAKDILALPPGSEVRVVAERERWLFVHIPGSRAGWIDRDAVEHLWPWAMQP